MELLQRSYSGENFRPKPMIENLRTHIAGAEADTTLLMTSWNESAHAQKVAAIFKEVLSMSGEPFGKEFGPAIDSLGPAGNRLRYAALAANKALFSSENSAIYSAAVELTVISIYRNSLYWVQVGCPHLIIANQKGFQPICYQPDWSGQIQQSSPLVSQALGLDLSVQMNCGNYRISGEEKLVLVARSSLPSSFYGAQQAELEVLSQILVEDNPEMPFWLGIFT